MGYPKFKYHKTEQPLLVQSEEQEKALGKEWAESPAEFGVISAPSQEQMVEMAVGKQAEAPVESEAPSQEPEKAPKSSKKAKE